MTLRCSLAIVCLALLACVSSTGPIDLGPVPDGPITTDATGYVALRSSGGFEPTYQFTVIARVRNRGAIPLYFLRCSPDSNHPLVFIVHVDSANPGGVATPSVGGATDLGTNGSVYEYTGCKGAGDKLYELDPGAVLIDTILAHGPNEFNGVTHQASGFGTGRFHLRYLAVLGAYGPTAPDSVSVSNDFIVRSAIR